MKNNVSLNSTQNIKNSNSKMGSVKKILSKNNKSIKKVDKNNVNTKNYY